MPVALDRANFDQWLDPETVPASLQELLRPLPDDALEMLAVNPIVNSSRVDGPECIAPAKE